MGDIPDKGLPTVAEIWWGAFMVWCSIRDVLWEDHVAHPDIFVLPHWQSMPCDRAGNLLKDGHDLAFRRLTFVSPGGTSHLLC